MSSANAATDRLPRLLALVPYLIARPGIPIAEAAADFNVTPKQLRKDLELLWMCGLPGYGPGDLIDLSFEGETITVTYDAGMSRPLRLTAAEATALLVALRALVDTPGVVDHDAVRRSLAKIESAVGQAQPAGVVVGLTMRESEETRRTRAIVVSALDRHRALRIRYYTASRDEITDRTVDPMRMLLVEGRSYLEGWCRRVEAVRLFRLDRVLDIQLLDAPSQPPEEAQARDLSAGLFQPSPQDLLVTLDLGPDAAWVAEYYPTETVVPNDHGGVVATLRVADPRWVRRLALRQAGSLAVLAPTSLADEVRDDARRALAAYGRP